MPLPELRFKLPQAVANIERAQFWSQVMQIPGMAVVKSEVYDSLGIAMPGKGDEVLEAPSRQEQGGLEALLQGMGKGDARKRDEVAVAARAQQATDGLSRALPAWLEPIKKKLIEARKSGATLAELRKQMLEWHPNTQALADAFADNVEAGLLGEAAAETLTAQCNQHEHDEGCDKGNSASRKISKVKKSNVYNVGSFPELERLGLPRGKVVIDGKSIRKGIGKKRWTANNAVRKIFGTLQNLQFAKEGKNDNNEDVLLAYGILDTEIKRHNKIVINKKSGKVISLHDIGKKAFEKERPVAR